MWALWRIDGSGPTLVSLHEDFGECFKEAGRITGETDRRAANREWFTPRRPRSVLPLPDPEDAVIAICRSDGDEEDKTPASPQPPASGKQEQDGR
jgi:hypothetical protein